MKDKEEFSWPWFILFLLLFWPAAIVYLIIFSVSK